MQQVKEELGRDAVILHTKKYREGGFLGYHSKEVVEVTAAIEDSDEKTSKKRTKRSSTADKEPAVRKNGTRLDVVSPAAAGVPSQQAISRYKTSGTEAGVRMADAPIAAPHFQPMTPEGLPMAGAFAKPAAAVADMAAAPRLVAAAAQESEDEKSAMPINQKRNDIMAASQEDTEKIQKLEDELAQMKTLLAQVMSKDQPQDAVTLQDALRQQEVDETILQDMAGRTAAGDTLIDVLDPRAKDVLAGYLGTVINFSEGIRLNKHGVRIAALIGATGVGKTTTLAKIAARFVLEKNIKAALITADTYRISAVEQLKTYSDIIGLPLEIVYSPDELKVAIHKHRDKDLILIDTAGRSQHNDYQMKELQDFLAVDPQIEKHLVMSATTKNRDAADILEKFSVCEPDRVIFTKTDETSSVGLILNLLAERDIALSFLANGQSVPDDIVPASPEKLADILLRE